MSRVNAGSLGYQSSEQPIIAGTDSIQRPKRPLRHSSPTILLGPIREFQYGANCQSTAVFHASSTCTFDVDFDDSDNGWN